MVFLNIVSKKVMGIYKVHTFLLALEYNTVREFLYVLFYYHVAITLNIPPF